MLLFVVTNAMVTSLIKAAKLTTSADNFAYFANQYKYSGTREWAEGGPERHFATFAKRQSGAKISKNDSYATRVC